MNVTVAEVVISRFVWHQYDIDTTKTRHRGQPRRVLATQLLGYIEGSKPVVVPNAIAVRTQAGTRQSVPMKSDTVCLSRHTSGARMAHQL